MRSRRCKPKVDQKGPQSLLHSLDSRRFGRSICFLCGIRLNKKNRTDEHVFPKWAQKRFSLWDQSLTLINGTAIPYRQLTIPCCADCNKKHLHPIERKVADASLRGADAVGRLDELTLFLWLGKIIYGILYKELFLARDRKSGRKSPIITKQVLKTLSLHHLFLNAARLPVRFTPAIPASIFVFRIKDIGEKQLQWDFRDSLTDLTVSCRIGRVGILAALHDGRAQRDSRDVFWHRYQGLELHPLQFTELTAAFFYSARLLNRVPKFMIFEGAPVQVLQSPLQGFSLKPIFDDWNQEHFARILSQMVGIPFDQIFQPGKGVVSWLHDDQGNIYLHDIQGLEVGRFG